MQSIEALIDPIREKVNDYFRGVEPFRVVVTTGGALLIFMKLRDYYNGTPQSWRLGLFGRMKKSFFTTLWAFKPLRAIVVDKKMDVTKAKMRADMAPKDKDRNLTLPAKGATSQAVLAMMDSRSKSMDPSFDWKSGQCTGTVYHGGNELSELCLEAMRKVFWSNPLHVSSFPTVRRMEAEVIRMVCDMYHGGPETCGAMTSGGTESILMAIRSYREWGREEKGIHYPNIIISQSTHVAFDKACDYLGLKCVHVPCLPDGRANVKRMIRKINSNTVALVGSAPSYPFGVIDDIPTLGAAAKKYNIGLHVDSCLGSFIVPFMKEAGFNDHTPFDFSVPGVTSISCDTHKYAYAPKGTSVIMYSTEDLRRRQYYGYADWSGGIYATPTMAGSRPGNLTAACWAVLMYFGRDGYVKACKEICDLTRQLVRRAAAIPGIIICGAEPGAADPAKGMTQTLAIRSDEFDVYLLVERLSKRGWELQPTQFPSSAHLGVTSVHVRNNILEPFIKDLTEESAAIMALPAGERKAAGSLKMYGASADIPDRSLVMEAAFALFDAYYTC